MTFGPSILTAASHLCEAQGHQSESQQLYNKDTVFLYLKNLQHISSQITRVSCNILSFSDKKQRLGNPKDTAKFLPNHLLPARPLSVESCVLKKRAIELIPRMNIIEAIVLLTCKDMNLLTYRQVNMRACQHSGQSQQKALSGARVNQKNIEPKTIFSDTNLHVTCLNKSQTLQTGMN